MGRWYPAFALFIMVEDCTIFEGCLLAAAECAVLSSVFDLFLTSPKLALVPLHMGVLGLVPKFGSMLTGNVEPTKFTGLPLGGRPAAADGRFFSVFGLHLGCLEKCCWVTFKLWSQFQVTGLCAV